MIPIKKKMSVVFGPKFESNIAEKRKKEVFGGDFGIFYHIN